MAKLDSRKVAMAQSPPKNLNEFASLVEVMKTLTGPNGCPWDKEQTPETLIPYLIEESHEVIEAIEQKDPKSVCEELGDLLLQIVFHAELAEQKREFNISDVIYSINDKMVRRHPHIFSDTKAATSEQVKINWDKIKNQEKQGKKKPDTLGGPLGAPALQRSHKIGEKTRRHAFDWQNHNEVWSKLDEELSELKDSINSQDRDSIDHELGDVLFTVAQLARHLKLDPETSLRRANRRFEDRFFKMKAMAEERKLDWETLKPEQKEALWQEVKKRESSTGPT